MTDQIESPCIGLCRLDEHQCCVGCRRTIDEIMAWPDANPARRQLILRAVEERKNPQAQ